MSANDSHKQDAQPVSSPSDPRRETRRPWLPLELRVLSISTNTLGGVGPTDVEITTYKAS